MASTLVLVVVFVLDLIAFALAVAAEQRRSTATIIKAADYSYCKYDKDIATALGLSAVLLLTVSQLLIMVVSRCLCFGKALRPSGSRSCAIALFITSWVFFIIAVSCLLAASVRNAYHTKYRNALSCKVVRKGIFAAGASFVVLTGIVSELYYVSHSKANDGEATYARDTGVRMGNL
ncbi:hypothetical protein L484_012120 [Morus notabilis]|uniref:Uncharacterized protein n=1 Tax=Morus notabilis TaxID=981085 RepID=W9RDB3_9ROSA|nr:uncharacterized protein LOC21395350 [Morus notabilis]EXB82807.1 hypothetical protein L484_012120 [Morus notabilis]